MRKRPFNATREQAYSSGRSAKRQKANTEQHPRQLDVLTMDEITNVRQIRAIVMDFSDTQRMQKGFTALRGFIQSCLFPSNGEEKVKDDDTLVDLRAILTEFLESEANVKSGEDNTDYFPNFLQAWGFAVQANNQYLLSAVVSTIALLLRAMNIIPELTTYGRILCTALLQPENLKLFYRCITASQDRVASPTLRLLTAINTWEGGSMCNLLHAAFDWTIKDLGRNLGGKKGAAVVQAGGGRMAAEDLNRPSLRTVFIRWILSFLTYGSIHVKSEILGHKGIITPLFKHLKADSPRIVEEVLRAFKEIVIDNTIPRVTKSIVFNEWVLGNLSSLYTRHEVVREGGAQTVADVAHDFLLMLCTRINGGVYFQDLGWYPPGTMIVDEKKKGTKLYNRALANFIQNLKPYADTLQQDLLLAILKAAPELVAEYFNSAMVFGFEPKATATWVGYCAFLTAVIELPIPRNFGLQGPPERPPAILVVIESICPNVLTKSMLAKCLGHENLLIRYLSTRMLVSSFNKLRTVLKQLESVYSALLDPSRWLHMRTELVEEFSRRIPEVTNVITAYTSAPTFEGGSLLREASIKLLLAYYDILPEVAFGKKFDANVPLVAFLSTDNHDILGKQGMELLEIEHLLTIAKEVPDVKWWNKPADSQLSEFTLALKLCTLVSAGTSLQRQLKEVTKTVVSKTYLFQTETIIEGFEAFLESLECVKDSKEFPSVLSFLDECLTRCARTPLKYTDDFCESVKETLGVSGDVKDLLYIRPVSPITMAITEQWKFLTGNDKESDEAKSETARWLEYFIKLSLLIGENEKVLGRLCGRLGEASQGARDITLQFNVLQALIKKSYDAKVPLSLPETFSTHKIGSELTCAKEKGLIISPVKFLVLQDRFIRLLMIDNTEENLVKELEKTLDSMEAIIALYLSSKSPLVTTIRQIAVMGIPLVKQAIESTDVVLQLPFLEAYMRFMGQLFEQPAVEGLRDCTIALLEGIASSHESSPESSIASRLKSLDFQLQRIFHNLLNATELHDLIDALLIHLTPETHIFLTSMVKSAILRKVTFSAELFHRIVKVCSESFELSKLMAEYVSENPSCLESFTMPLHGRLFKDRIALPLACAVIRHRQMIEYVLTDLEPILNDRTVFPVYLLAVLDILTESRSNSNTSQWRKVDPMSIERENKYRDLMEKRVRRLFDSLSEEISVATNSVTIELFSRSAHLFPAIDMEIILNKILANTERGNITTQTIPMINPLLTRREGKDLPRGMGKWLASIMEYLTRRFVEETLSTEETKTVARQFGKLLKEIKVPLAEIVPRSTINSLLEAILDKKVNVEDAVVLGAIMVSQASPKALDLAKHLQTILGNTKNPLNTKRNDEEFFVIHAHLAFIIHRLFSLSSSLHSNISTLDGILLLYRGSCSFIDKTLLDIIVNIESYLTQSVASRIGTWIFEENSAEIPLVTRPKGKLTATLSGKLFTRSVMNSPSIEVEASAEKFDDLDTYASLKNAEPARMATIYDWQFLLPVIAFALVSPNRILSIQAALSYGCIGYAIVGLCSSKKAVRNISMDLLAAFAAKLEESTLKERTQIIHLLCAILASMREVPAEEEKPIPTIIGVFLSRAVNILSNPTHFLYGKVMSLLLRRPLLDLWDIPRMLSNLGSEEEYYKDTNWKLNLLSAGIRKAQDLELYRKRKIFEMALSLYQSPYTGEKTKEKIVDLLWNTAEVEGGAATLLTRHGVIAWAMQRMIRGSAAAATAASSRESHGMSNVDGMLLKRTIARLDSTGSRGHVHEWSRGYLTMDLLEMYTYA